MSRDDRIILLRVLYFVTIACAAAFTTSTETRLTLIALISAMNIVGGWEKRAGRVGEPYRNREREGGE